MKVLLVNPPKVEGLSVIREDRCEITDQVTNLPPYSLLQMAALLREKSHEVSLIDANGTNLSYEKLTQKMSNLSFDALIFRFTPTTFREDMHVAKISKSISKDIVTIGLCWTLKSFARKIINDINELDFYITGDYITTVPNLINSINDKKDLKKTYGIVGKINGQIIETENKHLEYDLNDLPLPAYDLLPTLKNYFANTRHASPYTIIYSSKGCPYKCIYCTVAETEWLGRSAENVLKEIRYLKKEHDLKSLTFFDETFTYDRNRVIEICNKLIEEKISIIWYCNTRSNKIDLDLLKLMKRAGCRGISLGIESGSQKILNNAKKGITVEQNEKAIAAAKAAGIKTYCSFMFGLPGETEQTAQETIEFIKKNLPNGAQFNVVVPYPNTKLFNLAVEKGWISPQIDWTKLYQHISNMKIDGINSEELEMLRKKAYKSLYFNPGWIIMNVAWVLREPRDLTIGIKYYLKSMKNYILHDMEHAH